MEGWKALDSVERKGRKSSDFSRGRRRGIGGILLSLDALCQGDKGGEGGLMKLVLLGALDGLSTL